MKKIIYLANIRLPTEKAHGLQIMKTCEALVGLGAEVELWIASRKNYLAKEIDAISDFYGIKTKFPVRRLWVLDFLLSGGWRSAFYLEVLTFLVSAFFAVWKLKGDFIIYTRDEILLFLALIFRRKIFWESHMTLRTNFLAKLRLKNLAGIITISQSLKNIVAEKYGFNPEKIIVAHDAVDLEEFKNVLSKTEARKLLNLPLEKKIVVYTGSLFKQKGIYTLMETGRLFNEEWLFVLVGGPEKEFQKAGDVIKGQDVKNVVLTGQLEHSQAIKYLFSADVLVLPNSALDERTRDFTSPLKLFEYMASGRPIVASATPTLKEVLNEENAILVEPDNPLVLKEGILEVFNNKALGEALARKAREDVLEYTWQKRGEKILNFIQ